MTEGVFDYHTCDCKYGWFNNTMGVYWPPGVRCKPECQYPWITDLVNEVCICDEVNGYYLTYDNGEPWCRLDCPLFTGDPYKITNDNEHCWWCLPGMSLNTTDNLCWRDCYNEGIFYVYGGI